MINAAHNTMFNLDETWSSLKYDFISDIGYLKHKRKNSSSKNLIPLLHLISYVSLVFVSIKSYCQTLLLMPQANKEEFIELAVHIYAAEKGKHTQIQHSKFNIVTSRLALLLACNNAGKSSKKFKEK